MLVYVFLTFSLGRKIPFSIMYLFNIILDHIGLLFFHHLTIIQTAVDKPPQVLRAW